MTASREHGCGVDDGRLPRRRHGAKRPCRLMRTPALVAAFATCFTLSACLLFHVCDGADNVSAGSSSATSNSTGAELDVRSSNLTLTCEVDATVHPDPIFGTVDGYDVGGKRGVCFRSTYNDSRLEERNNPANLVLMNDILVQDRMSTDFTQYYACLNGTYIAAEPLESDALDVGRQAGSIRGQNFSFSFFVETDLAQYYEPFQVEKPESIQAWFRIMKCAAWTVGYCQPFLDTDSWSGYYSGFDEVDSSSFEYEPGMALESHSTDTGKNLTYSTKWTAGKLERVPGSACRYQAAFNLTVHLLDSMNKGQYFFIAHATLQLHRLNDTTTSNDIRNNKTTMRVDIATGIGGGLFDVGDMPTVFLVTKQTKIYVGVLIGVCGLATLILLLMIIKYRDNQVLVMAQAGLLGWLCLTTLVVVVFSFVILPTRDVFCQIETLLLIPATMVPAILVGRLWRVYSTLVGATRLGRQSPGAIANRREDRVMNFLGFLAFSKISFKIGDRSRSSVALRQAIPRRAVVQLVFVLCLPQTILQIFRTSFYHAYVYLEFNSDGTTGMQTCYTDSFYWATYAGVAIVAFMYILAFYLAWCTRKLPSIFNEKDQIFRAALVNGFVTMFWIGIMAIFDVAQMDSNISSMLIITIIIVISMTTNAAVVLPKIQRVLSGEKVVLTRALRELNGMHTGSSAGTPIFHQAPDSRPSRVGEPAPLVEVNPNEPLPDGMEKHLLRVSDTVNALLDLCNQGRPIEKDQWMAFAQATSAMSNDIARYQFQWPQIDSSGE